MKKTQKGLEQITKGAIGWVFLSPCAAALEASQRSRQGTAADAKGEKHLPLLSIIIIYYNKPYSIHSRINTYVV